MTWRLFAILLLVSLSGYVGLKLGSYWAWLLGHCLRLESQLLRRGLHNPQLLWSTPQNVEVLEITVVVTSCSGPDVVALSVVKDSYV